MSINSSMTSLRAGRVGRLACLCLVLSLSACGSSNKVTPETEVLASIQETLDGAAQTLESTPKGPSQEEINAILPSVFLSEELAAPVEERFNVVANRENAQSFFANLVAGTDYGVAVSPELDGEISLSLPNVTIDDVMQSVQQTYGYQISKRGNIYQVQPGGLQTRLFTVDYLNVNRSGTSSVQVSSSQNGQNSNNGGNNFNNGSFNNGSFNNGSFNNGGFNNGNLNNGNLNNGQTGNFVGGSGVQGGQVSTQTESKFWDDLEEVIAGLIGTTVRSEASVGTQGGGLLSGLGASASSATSRDGKSVVVQPQVGIVMVTAFPHELDRVAEYISHAQNILSREVTIQVQFLEVILNKGFQSAIDFDTFGPGGSTGTNNRITGDFSSNTDFNLDGISGPLSVVTNFTDFDAVFRILESRGTTQVLSSPSLKVLNNQKAVFQDGDEEYFQTGLNATTIAGGNNTTTNASASLQQFFSGISMDITPQISADGKITLHVHPTISTVVEQSKTIAGEQIPLARTSVRELDSVIRGEDGKIVVLGGLAYERSVDDLAGIPVVNDIPVVGAAFDQRRRQTVKSEFIILLRPMIASDENDKSFIRESNDRFRQLNQDINKAF
ncbi:MAG: secretin N-terminal domain-containing protein [Pseudomonadales bacterium]|nr:secretin N-terminal domain-containing protein [Pseudomonadales bacterium]